MIIDCIEIDGPFHMTIHDTQGVTYTLSRQHSDWRLDGRWMATGRVSRWAVLARALDKLEELHDVGV